MNLIRVKISELAQKAYPRKIKMSLPSTQHLPLVNARCHYNAVQAVKTGLAVGVVEVVMVYSDTCTAHYINLMADGSYVDFTLGQMCIDDDYRFIRHVSPNEYENINQSLIKLKAALVDPLPWPIKLIVLDNNNWC